MVTTAIKRNSLDEGKQVLRELALRYRQDPVFFAEHALGHYTWSKQREILQALSKYERVAIRASHSVSKTYTAAEAVCWFFNSYGDSKVITTAPTGRQVKDLLWSEIGKNYNSSRVKLEGECQTLRIKTLQKDHYVEGFSTDVQASAEGFHAPQLMFVFDEAKGLPQWIWDSVEGALSGGLCRWLVISTTDGVQPGENYHKIFMDKRYGKNWCKIHISVDDSPYVTGEKLRYIDIPDLKRPDIFKVKYIDPEKLSAQIASKKWRDGRAEAWGKDSVLYLTKVKGEIVDSTGDTPVQLSSVYKMFENYNDPKFEAFGTEEAGVDVARGGTDDSVFFKRKGMKVTGHLVVQSRDLPLKAKLVYLADQLCLFVEYNKQMLIKIDDTGVGGGLTDIMQSRGYAVVPINFQEVASNKDLYPNIISEMWYEVGKDVEAIACPQLDRLQTELVNRKSKPLDKKGRRVIESKKEYKDRGFASPDCADAFLLCFSTPGNIATRKEVANGKEDIDAAPDAVSIGADW